MCAAPTRVDLSENHFVFIDFLSENAIKKWADFPESDKIRYQAIFKNLEESNYLFKVFIMNEECELDNQYFDGFSRNETCMPAKMICVKKEGTALKGRFPCETGNFFYRFLPKEDLQIRKPLSEDAKKTQLQSVYRILAMEEAKNKGDLVLANFYDHVFETTAQQWPHFTEEQVKAGFSQFSKISSGGEGTVFKVMENSTGRIKALKVSRMISACEGSLIPFLQFLGENVTPHLTLVGDSFQVSALQDFSYFSATQFEKRAFSYRCFTMDCLEGDLEAIPFLQEYQVQQISVLHILESYNIQMYDHKRRNILYKKLDENDQFRGKKMVDYDYWHYTVEEYHFYLPKPEYLIKFADYDSWKVLTFTDKCVEKHSWLSPKNLTELSGRFPKPGGIDDTKILKL